MRRRFFSLTGGMLILLLLLGQSMGSSHSVTISGTVQYEDRTYDETGFTGTALKPVRGAVVEVVRNEDGAVLASGATGSDGTYSLTFTNSGPAGVYVWVKAQAADSTVILKNSTGALWAVSSAPIDESAGSSFTQDLTAAVASGGGIFNILDVFIEAADFVAGLATRPPLITAYWTENSCDGTYFNIFDDSIHVLGGCQGDADEYDDAVLLHEYGHFIAAHYSNDDSPGGVHVYSDHTLDIRLAWSEGWGGFFSSAVRNNPLYLDTVGDQAYISIDLEKVSTTPPGSLDSDAVYTTNEISVAAVLWDILDNTPGERFLNAAGFEGLSAGITPIWDVFANYLCPSCTVTTVSMEDFWDGWFAQGHGLQAAMEQVTLDRKMAFQADIFEPDGTVEDAALIGVNARSQAHTFYPAGDEDLIQFMATAGETYTIETLGLNNGADTSLEILNSDGVVVARSTSALD